MKMLHSERTALEEIKRLQEQVDELVELAHLVISSAPSWVVAKEAKNLLAKLDATPADPEGKK